MATAEEVIGAITALEAHFPTKFLTNDQKKLWMNDWCNDLRPYPLEVVAEACAQWRRFNTGKFPTFAQLSPVLTRVQGDRAKAGEPRPHEWRPLSDEEYEALSLRDKIRHRLILAHEERRKAGPMFVNRSVGKWIAGEHIPREEMPDAWHEHMRRAQNHEAEAARLRSVLYRAKPARQPYADEVLL